MSDIQCPHCKHERHADVEDYGSDGDDYTEQCEECGKKFAVTIDVRTRWDTQCVEEDHDWELEETIPFEGSDKYDWYRCTVCDETKMEKK